MKKGAADECIQDKDIASLASPRYGVDLSAAQSTIKPCSDTTCISCASDYTKCACSPGQFYHTTTNNPIQNKVCSSSNTVPGYGISSSANPFAGLSLLESCSVRSCQDCKANNLECLQCPSGHYFKPASDGVYDACFQPNSLSRGWGQRQGSFELFDCTQGLYFYDNSSKICHYKVLVEIDDITSIDDKENNRAVYRLRVEKGELNIAAGTPTTNGYLELSDADLGDFIDRHFEIQTEPSTQLTREIQGQVIRLAYPEFTQSFKITFKIKEQKLQPFYNSKAIQAPQDPVLKYKSNQGTTLLEFQVSPKQRPEDPNPVTNLTNGERQQHMTNQQINIVKFSSSTTQTISLVSKILTLILLIANFDLTSTIFRIIQLITVFDKLRFMNIDIKNSFGDFIRYIGGLFQVRFIQRNDYHRASVPKFNRFWEMNYSVIAYRNKPDAFLLFFAGIIIEIFASVLTRSILDLKNTEYLKIEKRGLLVKNLKKIASGLHLMTVSDIFFTSGHQILHQNISKLFLYPEYLASYVLSVISFLYCCWFVLDVILAFTKASQQEIENIVVEKQVITPEPKKDQKEEAENQQGHSHSHKCNQVHPEAESSFRNLGDSESFDRRISPLFSRHQSGPSKKKGKKNSSNLR